MDKMEFRVLMKYCFLKGKNTVEAKIWLDAEFPDTAPAKSTIKDCPAARSPRMTKARTTGWGKGQGGRAGQKETERTGTQ
ncbi:hypothetical protein GWI33_013132 [Rhynchophorus ferrugineus]|uniref:Mos1 transposase HTH domain-containing protein n=1 Tax=Rhynchophorus ferrugineus TaxID=354439 RepID=A0A834M6X8_RHYFE|nr:hypothetical protein GWI33_013132 [Rhynchophorus ferrugineus]